METKHAQETWYESSTGNHQGLIISETTGENIAVTYDKRNAPLIAAAPELLTAAENALEFFYFLMSDPDLPKECRADAHRKWDQANTAITKATGDQA